MEALVLSHNIKGLVILGAMGLLLLVNLLAISKTITKAGFSPSWMLVPLSSVVLWAVTFILLIVKLHPATDGGGFKLPTSMGNLRLLGLIDDASVLASWILFVVFAFSTWPVSGLRHTGPALALAGGAGPSTDREAALRAPGFSAGPTAPATATNTTATGTRGTATGTTTVAAPAPPVPAPRAPAPAGTIFCSWCGKERELNAQSIHYCGSMERPAAFCMCCGKPLPEGDESCAGCGTPATKLSRH